MRTFRAFFRAATGYEPYGYQARIARDGMPDVIQAPAGTGASDVILAWLWRRLHGPDPAATPRRLIYALPPRALPGQAAARARRWLADLGLADQVALQVAAGAWWDSQGDWRDSPHQPAIVIGTADVLVSKALNRAFDLSRALFPIDFALTTNGAHWLVDEARRCPQATATLRQLAAFTAMLGTAEPFGLTCMSAAAPGQFLSTPDNPTVKKPIQILDIERTGALATRLAAVRAVRRLPVDPGDYAATAAAILARRPPDELTLVVMNTVGAAQQVYRQLRAADANCTLLHPRFRPLEQMDRLAAADHARSGWYSSPAAPDRTGGADGTEPDRIEVDRIEVDRIEVDRIGVDRIERAGGRSGDGRIVVTAEVVDAGLDLDAALLVTEAAPWPSLVRRAARCNQAGLHPAGPEAWWVPPAEPSPDDRADIDATVAELTRLEGERLTVEQLLAREVPSTPVATSAIALADLDRLFDTDTDADADTDVGTVTVTDADAAADAETDADTEPDRSGRDVDISPFVADPGDLAAELAWATWTPADDGAPDQEIWSAPAEYRCPVPIGEVVAFARDRAVWRFDRPAGRWTKVTGQPQSRPRPGEVLLVSAAAGGYDADAGFDPSAPGPVPDCPVLLTRAESLARAELPAGDAASTPIPDADAVESDAGGPRPWQSLDEHSERVRDQADALLAVLGPRIPAAAATAAVVAGYLHDLGKAHEIWQDAICALADDDERFEVAAGRPWAKSGRDGPLLFAGDVAFRHELASLLLIDGPLAALLARSPDPDLTRFLVLAHHGKLRVHVRERDEPSPAAAPTTATAAAAEAAAEVIRGLRHGATAVVPAVLGQPAGRLTVDLDPFRLDDDRSWTRTVLDLRDRYGPFVLAYLEMIVRVADWRASGGRELPAG